MSIDDKDAENRGDSHTFSLSDDPKLALLRRINEYFEALPSLTVHFDAVYWCSQGVLYLSTGVQPLPTSQECTVAGPKDANS